MIRPAAHAAQPASATPRTVNPPAAASEALYAAYAVVAHDGLVRTVAYARSLQEKCRGRSNDADG